MYHIYRTGRLRNLKTGTPIEHALSIATASYKGLRSWVLARGQRHTVSAAPGGHAAFVISLLLFIAISRGVHAQVYMYFIRLTLFCVMNHDLWHCIKRTVLLHLLLILFHSNISAVTSLMFIALTKYKCLSACCFGFVTFKFVCFVVGLRLLHYNTIIH